MAIARLLILLHERDAHALERPDMLWTIAEAWRGAGMDVEIRRGLSGLPPADAVWNHVDLTVTPPAYRAALARYPLAVNGGVIDISKRRVSTIRLLHGDAWEGPVIVKTDANCGGGPEAHLLRRGSLRRAAVRARGWLGGRGGRERARWLATTRIASDAYPIFGSLGEVPSGVFDNPALVVERFLPEREGELFGLRTFYRLGDRTLSRRVLSTEPIVKASGVVRREWVTPHPDAVAAADRFALDYGKVDYVVHGGIATVLDINRTPTFGARLDDEARWRTRDHLAPGLHSLRSGTKGSDPFVPQDDPDPDADPVGR